VQAVMPGMPRTPSAVEIGARVESTFEGRSHRTARGSAIRYDRPRCRPLQSLRA
jgi:hypothetical protein